MNKRLCGEENKDYQLEVISTPGKKQTTWKKCNYIRFKKKTVFSISGMVFYTGIQQYTDNILLWDDALLLLFVHFQSAFFIPLLLLLPFSVCYLHMMIHSDLCLQKHLTVLFHLCTSNPPPSMSLSFSRLLSLSNNLFCKAE